MNVCLQGRLAPLAGKDVKDSVVVPEELEQRGHQVAKDNRGTVELREAQVRGPPHGILVHRPTTAG